ncbi:MAG: hypothetical protein M1821_001232 [Bathelium mastoideum]|nr:MAG: hypothetical protein M1821_001232 [Bathelium mastoideum]
MQIYSLDFEDLTGQNLVLQAVWVTKRGWQRDMEESEIRVITEHESVLYFSLQEFVLAAQFELNERLKYYFTEKFTKIQEGKSGVSMRKFMDNFNDDGTVKKTGLVYNLFERNCQHFAECLLENILLRNWGDPSRECQLWYPSEWQEGPLRRFQKPRNEYWRLIKENVEPAMFFIFSLMFLPL